MAVRSPLALLFLLGKIDLELVPSYVHSPACTNRISDLHKIPFHQPIGRGYILLTSILACETIRFASEVWIRTFWSSRGLGHQRRTILPVIGCFTGYFIIAVSSVGFLLAGSEWERFQALFPKVSGSILGGGHIADLKQVFILLTTVVLFLAHSILTFVNKFDSRPEPHECIIRSDGQASRRTSHEGCQNTPPLRKAEPDSRTWDKGTVIPTIDCHCFRTFDPQRDGFDSSAYENDDVLEQDLNTLDKRAAALKAHATYKNYNVCFISMQMDWNALMERARRLHSRREGRGYTCIGAIDAQKLAQKRWKLLRMADELEAGDLRFEHYIPGKPWHHEGYKDEVLTIHRIRGDCTLDHLKYWPLGVHFQKPENTSKFQLYIREYLLIYCHRAYPSLG